MSDLIDIEQTLASLIEMARSWGKFYSVSNGGNVSWQMEQLEGLIPAVRALLPVQVGDMVRLRKAPRCEGGWLRSKHFLIPGAIAEVKSIDFCSGEFSAYLRFEDESWVDDAGVVHPTEPKDRHVFGLGLDYFDRV